MIAKQTLWLLYCAGCLADYGGKFFARSWAEDYARINPLCPDCDGENY